MPVGMEMDGNQNADPLLHVELDNPTRDGRPKETLTSAAARASASINAPTMANVDSRSICMVQGKARSSLKADIRPFSGTLLRYNTVYRATAGAGSWGHCPQNQTLLSDALPNER